MPHLGRPPPFSTPTGFDSRTPAGYDWDTGLEERTPPEPTMSRRVFSATFSPGRNARRTGREDAVDVADSRQFGAATTRRSAPGMAAFRRAGPGCPRTPGCPAARVSPAA